MSTWLKDELRRIAGAPMTCTSHRCVRTERRMARRRGFWSVAVEGAVYVRAYNGQNSRWYRAAVRQKHCRWHQKEVTFEPVDGQSTISSTTYLEKYRKSPYLSPMIGPRARSATVKVMPCETTT